MSVWALRVRRDADGFYAHARGRVIAEPFATLAEAEEIRRAMPNGAEFETVMRWKHDPAPIAA